MPIAELPRIAFYCPGPSWSQSESDWMKSMLLFFDGIGLIIPDETTKYSLPDSPFVRDPDFTQALLDYGVLQILRPEQLMDQEAAEALHESLLELLDAPGSVLRPEKREDERFFEYYLNLTHAGIGSHDKRQESLGELLFEELRKRNLVGDLPSPIASFEAPYKIDRLISGEPGGQLMGVQRRVWVLILSLQAQIIRSAARRLGLDLQPVTSDTTVARLPILSSRLLGITSAAQAVAFDMERVAVNLGPIPLDEVLDFRKQHGASYRAYARNLRAFLVELSVLPEEERRDVWRQRADEIIDSAHELRKITRTAWRQPAASVALGILGAAYAVHQKEWPAGIISLLTGGVGASIKNVPESAHTYLFRIELELNRHKLH